MKFTDHQYLCLCEYLHFSLYKEEYSDGTHSAVKWKCPNIHDLKNILDKIDLAKILGNVCDKRLTSLGELSVVQLRDECEKLNISKKGKKVCAVQLKNLCMYILMKNPYNTWISCQEVFNCTIVRLIW